MTAQAEPAGDAAPRLLTVAMAAERLSVSQKTIRRWVEAGELGGYQLQRPQNGRRGGILRVSEADMVALAARMRL